MRNVYLHGFLGEKYGPIYRLKVATAGEAIRALNANFKGFTRDMSEHEWEVVRGAEDTGMRLGLEDTNAFRLGNADLHFIPVVAGSKRSGLVKTLLGGALIGAALFMVTGGLSAVAGAGVAAMAPAGLAGNLGMVGLALTVAGVASLLSPKTNPQKTGNGASYALGAVNVYTQGNPVPLVYGEVNAGSVVVSSGLSVELVPPGFVPVTGTVVDVSTPAGYVPLGLGGMISGTVGSNVGST